MSVEQYIHGRLRYNKQLGTNGDQTVGIGCIARTDGVRSKDIAELLKRHPQYLSRATDKDGHHPILYSKELYSSGTMSFVSTMFIPSTDNDRATWIDHLYLASDSRDRRLLNPEQWFGLRFVQEDPNSLDEAGNHRWYQLSAMDTFPRGEFRLLPLRQVLDLWKLSEEEFVQLLEAAVDSTSFRERNLVIVYDLDGDDCAQLPGWYEFGGDAERYNHFRMTQLLCWIYHLLPYSFRRTAGYDTMYNLYSEIQQIVFVPKKLVGVTSNRQIQLFFSRLTEVGGISTAGAKNDSRLLGAGYLYYPGRGFVNREKQSDTEIYREKGLIQDFFAGAVHELLSCGEDYRSALGRYETLFAQVDDRLIKAGKGAFCVDIGELREELFRCRVSLISDQDELFKIAKNMLQQPGKLSDQGSAREEVDLFGLLMANLRSRVDADHRAEWGGLLFSILGHASFPGQMDYVADFARFIDEEGAERGIELFNTAQKRLTAVSLTSESGVKGTAWDWLVYELLKRNSPVMGQILRERIREQRTYAGLLDLYGTICREANALPDPNARSLYAASAWKEIVACRCENSYDNVRYVFGSTFALDAVPNRDEVAEHIAALGSEMASQAERLPLYTDVVRRGPKEYLHIAEELERAAVPAAQRLRTGLRDGALFRDWLNGALAGKLDRENLLTVLEVAESECDDGSKGELLNKLTAYLDARRTPFGQGELKSWDSELKRRKLGALARIELRTHLAENALALRQRSGYTGDAGDAELFWFTGVLYAQRPDRAEGVKALGACCLDLVKQVEKRESMSYFALLLQVVPPIHSRELEKALLGLLIEPVLSGGTFVSAVSRQWKKENYDQFERSMVPWADSDVVRNADVEIWHHSGLSAQEWAKSIVSGRNDGKTRELILNWCREYCSGQERLGFLASVVQALGQRGATDQVLRLLVLPVTETVVPRLARTATRSDLKEFDAATACWEKDPRIQKLREMLLSDEMIELKWIDVSDYLLDPNKNRKLLEDAGLLRRGKAGLKGSQPDRMKDMAGILKDRERGNRWFRLMCGWLRDALADSVPFDESIAELCEALLNYAKTDRSADSPFTGRFLSSLSGIQSPTASQRLTKSLNWNNGLGRLARLVLAVEILNGEADEERSMEDPVFNIPSREAGIQDVACLICNGRLALQLSRQQEDILSILTRVPSLTEDILMMTSVNEFRGIMNAASGDARYQGVNREIEKMSRKKYWQTLGFLDSQEGQRSQRPRTGSRNRPGARRAR